MAYNDLFLRACRREATERTPIWMMRQAGRYMPEYRAIRARYGFLEMCKTPEVATEVTLQPVDLIGVDAAILFADILLPLEGMGLQLEFAKGEGPVIHNPVRSVAEARALTVSDPYEHTGYVMEAIKLCRRELENKVPLIGFAGAPFTLASYIIEGSGTEFDGEVRYPDAIAAQFKRMLDRAKHIFKQPLDPAEPPRPHRLVAAQKPRETDVDRQHRRRTRARGIAVQVQVIRLLTRREALIDRAFPPRRVRECGHVFR